MDIYTKQKQAHKQKTNCAYQGAMGEGVSIN